MCEVDACNFIGLLSHNEAKSNEVSQLSSSGCGATALLNVLVTLKVLSRDQVSNVDWSSCILRVRENDAPLAQYLLSRSTAGCTGQDLVSSMNKLVIQNHHVLNLSRSLDGLFVSYAEIIASGMSIQQFIINHLKQGCCLVATMNLQILGNDAWHHQMVYGVETAADVNDQDKLPDSIQEAGSGVDLVPQLGDCVVHCVNPVSGYSAVLFEKFLSTPSVLLIRSEDVVSRYDRPNSDNSIYDREEWCRFDVKKQIEAMMCAHFSSDNVAGPSHVVIPANYVGGFAVFKVCVK